MKRLIIGAFCLLVFFSACSDGDCNCGGGDEETPLLVTPRLAVRMAEPLSTNPFTGILEVYPCSSESAVYYGNYVNGKLTVFNGYYTIVDGQVFGEYNREIQLPIASYNMVYWGTPKYDEPIYNAPAIQQPGISTGVNVSELYFSLRPNGDGKTYKPVYDLVHAVKEAEVGKDDLETALTRVTAGLKVIVTKKNGEPFSSNVKSMSVEIGGIAEKLNFYTAEPFNMTKTVKFDLNRSEDNMEMSNATVMLFPSSATPDFKLVLTLQDDSEHTMSSKLKTALSANTRLTLNISIDKILGGETGDFTIEDWNEENESIDFPIID